MSGYQMATTERAGRMNRFREELLPPARSFYEQELGKLSRPNSKGWAMANCPFHQSKSGKSLSVNVNSGGFHCFGCDSKGGSIISFVMLSDPCDFKTACKQLGAWSDAGKVPLRRPGPLVPFLAMDFKINGGDYRASVKDEPRNYADKIRRFYREASDRLIELSQGDSERYTGEQENCWARMECAQDELRELETYE